MKIDKFAIVIFGISVEKSFQFRMLAKVFFIFALFSCSFAGISRCFNPNTTIFTEGISGTPYPGKLCNYNGKCIDTENQQIFFCYNFLLDIIVPCHNSTWDPISNFCAIVEVMNTGCETKKCVDQTRMLFYESSNIWECVGSNGKSKLCGNFQSNEDDLFFFAASTTLYGSLLGSPHPFGGKRCEFAFNAWEKKPESMTFELF